MLLIDLKREPSGDCAVMKAEYCFIFTDSCSQGRISWGAVFAK